MTTPETPRVDSRGAQEGDATNVSSNGAGQADVIASTRPEFGPRIQVNDGEASAFLSRLHHAPLNDGDRFCVSALPKGGKWNDLPLLPVPTADDDIGFSFAALAKEFGEVPGWMPSGHAGINLDAYVSVCEFGPETSGRDADGAVSIPGLWADLDVKPGNTQLPQTREELDRVIAGLPPVSMLVDSGSGGAHGYWLFTERQAADGIRDLPERWIRHVSEIASRVLGRRIEFDAVGDLARVMRLPGSVNQKVRKPVRLVVADGPSYSPHEFLAFLGTPNGDRTSALEPAEVPAVPAVVGRPVPPTPAPSWVAGSVGEKLQAVRDAPDGEGNTTINSVSFMVGQYVARGWITFDAAYAQILAAVESWAHPHPNREFTIRHGLTDGMKEPYPDLCAPDDVIQLRIADEVDRERVRRGARALLDAEESEAARVPRVRRTAREYASVEQPLRVMHDVLAAEVNLLGGPSEAGKSLLARDWALAVAAGVPWEGHIVPEARPVVWVASEGMDDFRERWQEHPLFDRAADNLYVLDQTVNLLDRDDVGRFLEEFGDVRPGLAVFDVIYGMGLPDDNGTKDVGPLIGAMKRISKEWGGGTLALGHNGHNGERRFRGSSMWRQLAYTEWHLADGRLSCEKSKITAAKHRVGRSYRPEYPNLRWLTPSDVVVGEAQRLVAIREDIERNPDESQRARADRLAPVIGTSPGTARRLIRGIEGGAS